MTLKSRNGDIWEFEEKEWGYVWKNVPEYTRFGYFSDSHDDICFIDPPGGPFLEVGDDIKEKEIIVHIQVNDDNSVNIYTHKKEG